LPLICIVIESDLRKRVKIEIICRAGTALPLTSSRNDRLCDSLRANRAAEASIDRQTCALATLGGITPAIIV